MSDKILIIDDEEDIRDLIKYTLEKEGFIVKTSSNGKEGIKEAKKFIPDFIILDIMMPEMDGMETCEKLREIPELNHTFISFLSARTEDYSQIAGFDSGADDYIHKPIKPKLLVSRIQAILRRRNKKNKVKSEEQKAQLLIDRNKYLVYLNGEELSLPRKEFELLDLLFQKNGEVCTREHILEKIWGNDVIVGDRTIDVHIRKLREKIGEKSIKTIKGVGYKYRDTSSE